MNRVLSSSLSLVLFFGALGVKSEPEMIDRVIAVVDENVVLESELVRRANSIVNQIKERKQTVPALSLIHI